MSDPVDMQELFKQAAKIAEVVPASMQEAAFHRALDLLTDTERSATKPKVTCRGQGRGSSGSNKGKTGSREDDRVARVAAISRHNAPEVDQESAVLGRSIALLVVASREAEVDGLTAPEIAKILTEKFRHRTTRQSVQSALDASGNMVDRHKSGSEAALYRVMKAGEEWLSKPAEQRAASSKSRTRRRASAKKVAPAASPKKAARPKTTGTGKKPASSARSATANRKSGPKAVLEALITEGFFAEPRGLAEIKQQIRDQKALSFESTDLSPALIRLLRERKLTRSKVGKQYVYTAA